MNVKHDSCLPVRLCLTKENFEIPINNKRYVQHAGHNK